MAVVAKEIILNWTKNYPLIKNISEHISTPLPSKHSGDGLFSLNLAL